MLVICDGGGSNADSKVGKIGKEYWGFRIRQNELVKNGVVRMGKSSSYSLETRRAEGKGSRVVMSD